MRFLPFILGGVLVLGGCAAPDAGDGGSAGWFGDSSKPSAGKAEGPRTPGALFWLGLSVTVIGVIGVVLKAKLPILPAGTAVTAIPIGIGLMIAADFLAAYPWLMWLIPVALIGFGVVEWIGRGKVKRWLIDKAGELKAEAT